MNLNISPISFQSAKISKKAAKNGLVAASAVIAASVTGKALQDQPEDSSLTTKSETTDKKKRRNIEALQKHYIEENIAQQKLAIRIKARLQEAIENNETLTLEKLSTSLGVPLTKISTIIYKKQSLYPDIKEMFNQSKDSSHTLGSRKKQNNINISGVINEAAKFCTDSDTVIGVEDDYVNSLSETIKLVNWHEDAEKELINNFKYAPAFADMLVSTKDGNGKFRETVSAKNITNIFEAHRINPQLTEELVQELDENGQFKYILSKIYNIVKITTNYPELIEEAKENPSLVMHLLNETDENDNPRFGTNEIKNLCKWSKKMPKYTDYLIKNSISSASKKTDGSGKSKNTPRFTGEQICYILDQYTQYPEDVNYLVNTKIPNYNRNIYRLNGDTVVEVLKALDSEDKQKSDLAYRLVNDDTAVDYRCSETPYIINRLKTYDKDRVKMENSLTTKTKGVDELFYKNDGTPIYTKEEVNTLYNFKMKYPEQYQILVENKYTMARTPKGLVFYPQDKNNCSFGSTVMLTKRQIIDIIKTNPQKYLKMLSGYPKIISKEASVFNWNTKLYEYLMDTKNKKGLINQSHI